MNPKHTLRNYLIKHFLLILLLVGIAEGCISLLYNNLVLPWLSAHFGFNGILADAGFSETVRFFALNLLGLCLGSIANFLPGHVGIFLQNATSRYTKEQFLDIIIPDASHMSGFEQQLYISSVICLLLLLCIIWLLPYVIAAVCFSVLVSKRAALLEATHREQQLSYEKQRNLLLSDVAHDIKTPLTTVIGYASALAGGSVPEPQKQQEYLNAICQKSMQINELVVLLFDYVKLDSEGFQLKKETLSLTELLREAVADVYTDFEEKNMQLDLEIPDEPYPVSVDRIQFARAIRNILINAVNHNPAGTRVFVELKRSGDDFVISIRDNGALIPEETAAHLFDPFVQGDASRSGNRGSGLGLSITKKVISMHGGEVRFYQNREEMGACEKEFVIRVKDTLAEY